MTDARLRELSRRFRETGSVEDEALWLKERVRVGELSQERLGAAAPLESQAAARLVVKPDPVASLELLGSAAVVRAFLAIAHADSPKWARGKRGKGAAARARRFALAASEFVLEPGAKRAAAAVGLEDGAVVEPGSGGQSSMQCKSPQGQGCATWHHPRPQGLAPPI